MVNPGQDDEVLSIEAAKQRSNGNPQVVRELAQLLLDECRSRMDDLQRGLAEGDVGKVKRTLHTLHGAAGVFDSRAVSTTAKSMEKCLDSDGLEGVKSRVEELSQQVTRLEDALRAFLGQTGDSRGD